MTKINFRNIESSIKRRNQEIQNLQQVLWKYVTLDGNFRFVVDEHFKKEAVAIVQKTNQFHRQNSSDIKLMEKARELAAKYDLPIDRNGHPQDNPECLNLEQIESDARRRLVNLEFQQDQALFNGKYSPEIQKIIEPGISECKRKIDAVKLTREALEEI